MLAAGTPAPAGWLTREVEFRAGGTGVALAETQTAQTLNQGRWLHDG